MTLVIGPAGAGKTEAIARGLDGMRARHVHFRVRRAHAELVAFVRGLVDELAPTVPALGVGFASAAATARRSMRPALVLGEWFALHLGSERAVVALDDLHLVDESADVRDFLIRAIGFAAPEVRWVLGTRETHRWPLASWLAGSVAGVPLALELDRNREPHDDAAVAAAARVWFDALAGERATTASVLALLPTLDASHLAHLSGAHELIAELDERFPYARSGDRLRPEFAAEIVRASTPLDAAVVAGARRALEAAPVAERLQHATEIGDGAAIVDLMNSDGFALIDAHRGDIVEQAVSRLSADERRSCALAVLLEATRETELGRYDVAESWYLHAAHIASDAAGRARVEFEYGSDLLRRARTDCIETLERVSECSVTPSFDARATAALGAAYAAADRWELARATIADALAAVEAWPEGEDVAARARIYRQAAYVFLRDANPLAAAKFARRAIDLGERWGLDEIVAGALSVLLVVATSHEDDGAETVDLLQRLERCARRLDNTFWLRYARLGLLDAYGERAAWAEVDRMEQLLASQELENDTLHTDETLVRTRALRAAGTGDFNSALRLLRTSSDHVADAGLRAFRQAEIATYAAAAGDREAAARAIDTEILHALPSGASALVVRTELQIALAQFLLGHSRVARMRLRRVAGEAARFPRMRVLHEAIGCVLAFDDEQAETTGAAMLESLVALHACGLGGMASILGALPLAVIVRRAS
ncbi:MAG: hypothetical protein NVS3B16_19700 [Vulcanimicrobiaceae bacterium]